MTMRIGAPISSVLDSTSVSVKNGASPLALHRLCSFSQERMSYVEEDGIVLYQSKDGAGQKVFDVLEWLTAMCSHAPDGGEQMVRYYGYYRNISRGKRREQEQDGLPPCTSSSQMAHLNSSEKTGPG
jgi:hypothetical protein